MCACEREIERAEREQRGGEMERECESGYKISSNELEAEWNQSSKYSRVIELSNIFGVLC